ncbi:sporulation-delaying protein SdpB family protein [Microbacterium nymphoidis]|uniref:sporulation-delaying protein SdpB family protein n=1 Tax=Microbacterium nymphoidis TaxID=2898586 RepID=UPI001E35F6E8|nr:sporulation-delaying protein SdpB family protein [Microbacterium nymphoidis]MCD2498497.1 hypothetical protein [Microbacterium nymphoidis]
MLKLRILGRIDNWTSRRIGAFVSQNPFTNVYGAARSIVALSGLLVLILNPADILFVASPATGTGVTCPSIPSLYCVIPDSGVAKIIAIVVLLAVISGILPQVTAPLHWWVAFSYQASATTLEGGDQIAAIITLLLIPVAILDPRWNHWIPVGRTHRGTQYRRATALLFLLLIQVQASVIYLVAGVAKFAEPEWQDGTAMYYWLTHPVFGSPEWQSGIYLLVLSGPVVVTLVTWAVPVLEIVAAGAIFMQQEGKYVVLALIMAMHVMIAVSMGLPAFSLVMIALDLLYLWPVSKPFRFSWRSRSGAQTPSVSSGFTRLDSRAYQP